MVFSLIPTTVWAASNSTVVLHPSVGSTVTGVKVKVGDKIDGHAITSISGYDITVDLGKYNVNNDTFRLPYAKDIWEGVDNNKVDYISWAGSGSNSRSEGGSALLANGKNTAYYYFKGAPVLLTFTLNYDANGGNGAPASQTYKATSQYEKSYTFTISSQTPTREGYNFLGWNTDKNAATASKQPGNTIVVNNNNNPTTLYAVWEEKAPVMPDDPKVGENFDFSKDIVKVICETTDTHNDSYGLKNGYYSVSDKKQLANGNWQCKITIDLDRYFALYNSEHTGHTRDMNHPKATSIMRIYPTWYASTGKWSSAESLIDAAEIYVKCEATQPEGPGENDTPNMAELLTVECVTADAKHTPKSAQYDIVEQGTVEHPTDTTWTYTVTLNRTTYIDKFNGETKTAHTDKAPNDVITLTWNWENGKWTKGFDENPVIKCECKTEIEPPTDGPTDDDVKAALGNLWVKCINGPKTGSNCTPCKWPAKLGYSGSDSLTKVSDTEYTVELGVDVFVNAYTKRAGEEHGLMSAKTLTWVLTFTEGKWVGAPKEADVDDVIQVAHRVPVHLVIYRNGDTSKAYKDIALNSELPGTVIDLTKLKIGDYYQGDVEFYGWYNDGKWNEYTKDLANPPAGLERITVNGWTNLKCMVYDLDKVVYFQSAEDLAAYQKDHSKNDGLLYTTTVRRGTTLPTADAPAATREGYTFQYWSREGQYQDVTGQTVSGWTNLYAAWTPNTDTPYKVEHYKQKLDGTYVKADTDELTGTTDTRATAVAKSYTGFTVDKTVEGTVESGIIAGDGSLVLKLYYTRNSYIISSNLRINGGDANLADGKTYPWSYRYGGKFEETIDYTEMFDALKTRAMKVDEANGPVDSVVTLCFPGDYPATAKKLFNDTILTYGQDGGGWNPGNKNTAPIWGFATNVYAVTFNYKDDKTATATQNVEYGNMATEPQKVDRPGYRFLGWFTEDGKAFDFSTPITKSMTLTAKWEIVNINAYIIPITSDGTQLVGAGFDMALNTTTLGRVGLPGYEDEDAVRIHFATFASSAGLADADDYFPGTDPLVVKAVADLKNGLERRFAAGVNEAKADGIMSKTNWTYLHVGELDDEEDTNFLSGNLVFYSARFVTEDSEHVTGMPNAEYTHNAVAVYDYYLDGETITIPDAVPERYGYDFLGWSVKAVPAENDKLLKAGDTVTVDGDVVFTAQWKLKEYTVSFDSKGGTKVDSQIVEHGSTATKPGNPHRNDYTFKGWYLDGKKFDFSTPITGDITLVARWATKTSGGSNGSSDTTTKDNGKTVQSGKTFDGGIALYVGLSVLSATGSALVITKKKRG